MALQIHIAPSLSISHPAKRPRYASSTAAPMPVPIAPSYPLLQSAKRPTVIVPPVPAAIRAPGTGSCLLHNAQSHSTLMPAMLRRWTKEQSAATADPTGTATVTTVAAAAGAAAGTAATAAGSAAATALDWMHEYFNGITWTRFPAPVNQKLNSCQKEARWSSARLTVDGVVFVFEFLRMVQICVETGAQRSIRWTNPTTGDLVEPGTVWAAPNFMPAVLAPWQDPRGKDLLEALEATAPEFRRIKRLFEESEAPATSMFNLTLPKLHGTVVAVHKVCPTANAGFWARRQALFNSVEEQLKSTPDKQPNRVEAWHGTGAKAVVAILNTGFSVGAVANGRVLGHGVYFAPHNLPALSATYAEPDSSNVGHVFLCDVLLGNVELAKAGMMAPSSPEFDNGVDDMSDPKRIVVWPGNITTHVMPKYLVSFSL